MCELWPYARASDQFFSVPDQKFREIGMTRLLSCMLQPTTLLSHGIRSNLNVERGLTLAMGTVLTCEETGAFRTGVQASKYVPDLA